MNLDDMAFGWLFIRQILTLNGRLLMTRKSFWIRFLLAAMMLSMLFI